MNRCYCKTSTKTDHYQIILFLVLYILQVKPSNIDTPPLNITSLSSITVVVSTRHIVNIYYTVFIIISYASKPVLVVFVNQVPM